MLTQGKGYVAPRYYWKVETGLARCSGNFGQRRQRWAIYLGHICGSVRTAGRGQAYGRNGRGYGVVGGTQGNILSPLGGAVARSAGLSSYFVLSLFTRSHTCSSTTTHSTPAKGLLFRFCKTPDKIQIKTNLSECEGNSFRTDK